MTDHCTHTFRKIIASYNWINKSNIRTYRLRCKCCGYRWNVYYDRKLKKEVLVSRTSDDRPLNTKRLTPAEVRTILIDPRPGAELAKELGMSHQSISQVRLGQAYSRLWPELPRKVSKRPKQGPAIKEDPNLLSCRTCTHWWQRRCGLDVPEAGGAFAEDCSFYQKDK